MPGPLSLSSSIEALTVIEHKLRHSLDTNQTHMSVSVLIVEDTGSRIQVMRTALMQSPYLPTMQALARKVIHNLCYTTFELFTLSVSWMS